MRFLKTPAIISLLIPLLNSALAQQISEPCFNSISPLGKFYDSDYIVNLCGSCSDRFHGANLLEWSGTEWLGQLPYAHVKRPPPEGCNTRALWLGYENWTAGGEAVALQLDKKLQPGNKYTFTFTYSLDGQNPYDPDSALSFSPIVYTTAIKPGSEWQYVKVGRLTGTRGWRTDSISFVASSDQEGHQWLIVHAVETSGLILSSCVIPNPIESDFLGPDTTLCFGTDITLRAVEDPAYSYAWNTGETQSTITVSGPGVFSILIQNHHCESRDSVVVYYEDCMPSLVMPNFFSPNGDTFNERFAPKEHNYIDSGSVVIYNRWEKQIYEGDLFSGWDGAGASTGIYFYLIKYVDRRSVVYERRGTVTLMR